MSKIKVLKDYKRLQNCAISGRKVTYVFKKLDSIRLISHN